MAYEMGNNNYNYFSEGLKLYAKDNMIYSKASTFLSTYSPYNLKYDINYINNILKNLIGDDLMDFLFVGKYIRIEQENRKKLLKNEISQEEYNGGAIWDIQNGIKSLYDDSYNVHPFKSDLVNMTDYFDLDTLECFKNDITAFYNSIKPFLISCSNIERSSKSLIDVNAFFNYDEQIKSIQFIRNDGYSIDFDVDYNDIDYLIKTLIKIKEVNSSEQE